MSADGKFSWLEVECLGACCNAPMVQINADYYEDLTPENFGTLLDDLAAGRPVKVGSQVGRTSSEPENAVNTLTDATLYDGSRVGAWRKRFEEAANDGAEAKANAEAKSAEASAASAPKAAKPDAGRANERPATDAPGQRAAAGEAPTKPEERAKASDPGKTGEGAGSPVPQASSPKASSPKTSSPKSEG